MAWYWLKNAGNGEHFSKKDIVFECFHNFVAFSQWGNTIFGIMSRLSENGGNAEVRDAFQKTMSGDFDNANGEPYTPLELFVMELFRTISPNGGSISAIQDARESRSMVNHLTHALACRLNGIVISARRTPAPVSAQYIGRIQNNSILSAIAACRPVLRLTRRNVSR